MSPRTTDGPQEESLETSLHKQEWLVLVEGTSEPQGEVMGTPDIHTGCGVNPGILPHAKNPIQSEL